MIFTDFDLLNAREMEVAAAIAEAARKSDPAVKILNHPAHVLERYDLLRMMHLKGLSPISICRVNDYEQPQDFPVFIRAEDGANGPETGILDDLNAYRAAVSELRENGKPAKGRIAVKFHAQPNRDGYFRKFGVLRIGDRIIPQHVQYSKSWVVKSNKQLRDDERTAEELVYIRENPHRDLVEQAFDVGNLQFGRADFAVDDDQFALFEINSNPTFPRFHLGSPERAERRALLREKIVEAFAAIDHREGYRQMVRFTPPMPYRDYVSVSEWGVMHKLGLYLRLWRRTKPVQRTQSSDP